MILHRILRSSAVVLLALSVCAVFGQNQTERVEVDDADIAISYRADIIAVPSSRWDGIIASRDIKNGNCTTASGVCYSADIIPTRTKNGTWHEGSDISTAVYTFIGTGVDVYFVFRNDRGVQTNVTFLIDGQERGSLLRIGTGVGDEGGYIYNFTAFTISNLPDQQHVLTIAQGSTSLIIFDYLTYTRTVAVTSSSVPASTSAASTLGGTQTSSASSATSTGSPSNVGAIAGGVVGGIVFLAVGIAGLIYFFCRRNRKKRIGQNSDEIPSDLPVQATSPYYAPLSQQQPAHHEPWNAQQMNPQQTSQVNSTPVVAPIINPPSSKRGASSASPPTMSYNQSPSSRGSGDLRDINMIPQRQEDAGVVLMTGDLPPAYPTYRAP